MRTEQQLRDLLEKLSQGLATQEEEKLLQEWFTQIGLQQFTPDLSSNDKQRMLKSLLRSPRFASKVEPGKVHSLGNWKHWTVAAAVIGIVFFSWTFFNKPSTRELAFVQISTGSREVRQVILPDSSVVWLNAHSLLAYHPDFRTHRQARLSGEAFFKVTHDQEHPFTVLTQDSLQTTVLGTEFDVRSYERLAETQVTVLSGRVKVSLQRNNQTLGILTTNSAIRFNRQKGSYLQTGEQADALAGWRNGHWALNNQGIEELALLLYNQYGVTLLNKQGLAGTLRINANFSSQQSAREIVSTFCQLAGCRQRWKDNTTVELY